MNSLCRELCRRSCELRLEPVVVVAEVQGDHLEDFDQDVGDEGRAAIVVVDRRHQAERMLRNSVLGILQADHAELSVSRPNRELTMGLVDQVRGSAIAPSNLVLLNHFRKRCVEIQSEQPTYSETSSSERKSPTVEPWKHILHRRLPQRPEIIRFCELSFLSDCLQLKEGSTDTHSFSSGYARNRSLAVAILAQATGSVACRMHDLKHMPMSCAQH